MQIEKKAVDGVVNLNEMNLIFDAQQLDCLNSQ